MTDCAERAPQDPLQRLGIRIIRLETVGSTNDYIKELAPSGPVLVTAVRQTAGRGRGDHSFHSPEGGIYFSYGFRPEGPEEARLLTVRAAVCTAEAINSVCGLGCGIKWVNDIYLRGRKVCGILCENAGGLYIAGIGINASAVGFPEELSGIAGGIADGPGGAGRLSAGTRDEIISRITGGLMAPFSPEEVIEKYTALSVLTGKTVHFVRDGRPESGIAAGFDEEGGLIISGPQGRTTLRCGEVSVKL